MGEGQTTSMLFMYINASATRIDNDGKNLCLSDVCESCRKVICCEIIRCFENSSSAWGIEGNESHIDYTPYKYRNRQEIICVG